MWDLREDDPRKVGSFRIVARLGSGGMGTVYLAEREGRDGQVAVKMIRSDHAQEEGFRRRFEREATAASSVRSPYTVRVISFDTQAPEPWIAAEYVEGLSLRDHVLSRGPLGMGDAVELALGLTFGLASIHRAGLVHRDLKPGNILLTEKGPKVIDFGLAYATDFSHATHTGVVLGTPGYFSPEQVQGKPVSPASDIFSLGAVLTFASSGDHAFRGATPLTAQYHVVHEDPKLAGVPEELQDLIAACMAKEPQERPPINVILAQLTSLRSYGHKRGRGSPRRTSPSSVADSTAETPAASTPPRRWLALTASTAALLATGALAGPWIFPGYGPDREASSVSPTRTSAWPTYTPAPASVPDDLSPDYDPEESALVSGYEKYKYNFLTFSYFRGECVLDGALNAEDGMAVQNSGEYEIFVHPLERRGGQISLASISVKSNQSEPKEEAMEIRVYNPKGKAFVIPVPKGKRDWTFRWPDALTAERALDKEESIQSQLMEGPYMVLLVHGWARACSGLTGNPKSN
ncbi:serine/threonine protein kinase [Streptomyces hydrogenans]